MPFDGVGFIGNESVRKMDEVIDLLGTPDKWCKGALRSHDGRYCIRGAVRAVDAADTLEPSILQAIGQVAGKRFRRIESFNDHPNTSHEQVLAVLYRARENLSLGDVGIARERVAPSSVPDRDLGQRHPRLVRRRLSLGLREQSLPAPGATASGAGPRRLCRDGSMVGGGYVCRSPNRDQSCASASSRTTSSSSVCVKSR